MVVSQIYSDNFPYSILVVLLFFVFDLKMVKIFDAI